MLCLPLYALGATAVGLVNEQEAFRATAAREMHARSDWVVPTLRGDPYLAKPPLIYWAQLSLAQLRGAEPDLLDLRLTTAIFGWLGVVATYCVARRFARSMGADDRGATSAARWSAAGLAVGVLFVRSARSGEIDILLVAPVVVAIGALHAAWESGAVRRRTDWRAIAIASLACAVAALAKGPVPLAVVAIAILGAMIGARAWRDLRWVRLEPPILAGFASLWAWAALVRARIGDVTVDAAAATELRENLVFFAPMSPVKNIEYLLYGALPIGVAAVVALLWCIRERPRPSRSALILIAWIVGGFVLFSVSSKGVARYLTPLWPAIAMAGGMWIALVVRPWAQSRGAWVRIRAVCAAAILACGAGQAVWYAVCRPIIYGARSPRALAESMARTPGVSAEHLGIWDISPRALEYHWHHPVERWNEKSFDALLARITAAPGEYWLLAQCETDRVVAHRGSVRTMLTDAGCSWEPTDLGARWVFDPDHTTVELLRIRRTAP